MSKKTKWEVGLTFDLSQVVCTHSLFHVESSSLCTISTVMSWKHKLQDSGKWKIIFFKVFYFWFIGAGGGALFQSLPAFTCGSCDCNWTYSCSNLQHRNISGTNDFYLSGPFFHSSTDEQGKGRIGNKNKRKKNYQKKPWKLRLTSPVLT